MQIRLASAKTSLLVAATLLVVSGCGYDDIASTSFRIGSAGDVFSSGKAISSASYSIDGSLGNAGGLSSSASFALESSLQTGASCGDGFVDPGEECDHGDLDGASCASEGFDSGSLSCASDCSFDTSDCANESGGGRGGGGGARTVPVYGFPEPTAEPASSDYGSGDLNGDARIDDYDLSVFVRSWGTSYDLADLNHDGVVDDYDFSIFITRWSNQLP